MKFLRQFSIILFISFLGEILHMLIPLPVPASVYGLVLMLGALVTGVLKIGQVRETATFLIEIMPVMFIPAGVGLMESWPSLAAGNRHYDSDDDPGNGSDGKGDTGDDRKGEER